MALSTSTSLSVTVAHAISFLTRPLIISYSATTIIKLQLVLEANLTALFAPTWVAKDPLRGSGRRCLTLSPNTLPPRAIYSACIAAGVQWFDWIALLGGREFYFFVDPGCVSIRFGRKASSGGQLITIWADEVPSPIVPTHKAKPAALFDEEMIQAQVKAQAEARAKTQSKTLAQQLLEEDQEEDDQLFAMIADEVSAPTWMTPILDQFPIPARNSSPLSTISSHSRSSSRSSNSSSGFSFSSAETYSSLTSMSTLASCSPDSTPNAVGEKVQSKQSRRERARQARVFVDTTKIDVTPYDGGKTTVLTGGVMLGGAPTVAKEKKAPRPALVASNNWRAVRA